MAPQQAILMTVRCSFPGVCIAATAFFAGGIVGSFLVNRCADTPHTPAAVRTGTRHADDALVRLLLDEDLSGRSFDFATVVNACSGRSVMALGSDPSHLRVVAAIHSAVNGTLLNLNRPDSPVRALRRINEASRFFEDGIMERINRSEGLRCEIPQTRDGVRQRSGYPDLRITDSISGRVFYLDPKLVEAGSAGGTLRTFYFEPKTETLKINDDAVHLLVGIEHDGKAQKWTFTGWRLIDLSTLKVGLKAEFQASNAELYRKSELSLPESIR